MAANDSLGDRMKGYEATFQGRLINRMYTIIRLDGKAFHTYTKGLKRPFDKGLVDDMVSTTKFLCENIQGCKAGYVQSDEITLILTDFDNHNTIAWFDNEIQKMVSISTSLATSKFNQLRTIRRLSEMGLERGSDQMKEIMTIRLAQFDARVFQIPTLSEAYNNILWRQRDCIRNSVSSAAQSVFSHKELHLKNVDQMEIMINQRLDFFNEKIRACGYQIEEDAGWKGLPKHLKVGTTLVKKKVQKLFPEETYLKDQKRNDEGSLWGYYLSPDENGFQYFKMVSKWVEEPIIYSGESSVMNYLSLPLNA